MPSLWTFPGPRKLEKKRYKITLGCEKANLFIFVKCFDEPPSTTYDARVNGAPTKPRTAALLSTWEHKDKDEYYTKKFHIGYETT